MNIVANLGLPCPSSYWHNSSDYKILDLGEKTTHTSSNENASVDGKDARRKSL